MSKNYKWYKIAENAQDLIFEKNEIMEIEVAGKKICITALKENLRACAAKCPHAGGKISNGYVDALGNIVCPLHRYKFSLDTGRNTSGEGYFLKTYPIEQREKGVYIGIEEKGMINWIK